MVNARKIQKINTLILSEEAAEQFQCFGHLQYALMVHQPPVIAIAILKAKGSQEIAERMTLVRQTTLSPKKSPGLNTKKIENKLNKLMDNVYGSEFLLTNPSAFMPLGKGDKVLVIGNIKNLDDKGYFKKSIHSSFRLTPTPKNETANLFNFSFPVTGTTGTAGEKEYEKKSIGMLKRKTAETLASFNNLLRLMKEREDDRE